MPHYSLNQLLAWMLVSLVSVLVWSTSIFFLHLTKVTILIQTQTFKSLLFPTGQNAGALLFSCGPLSGDRYWFSLSSIGPCGSPQQDLDTALRSQQGCQHIQIVGLCRSCLHSQFLSPKVQKSTVETIWEWWIRHSCHQQQRHSAEKKLQKKISGEISRESCWGVTTFTPPTATSPHAAGWLTRASCTASGGAVIARTSSKHKYMICCSWLLGWMFAFTTFPRCTDKKGQVSVNVSACHDDLWQQVCPVVCSVKTSKSLVSQPNVLTTSETFKSRFFKIFS